MEEQTLARYFSCTNLPLNAFLVICALDGVTYILVTVMATLMGLLSKVKFIGLCICSQLPPTGCCTSFFVPSLAKQIVR